MQPQPERISPRSGKLTNFTAVPNSVVQHQKMLTPAELRLVLLVLQWREATITDETWQEKTGLDKRMKAMAIKGLREKGLHVSGAGKRAKYFFDVNGWDSWVRTRPRHERAHTTGRSKSVSAKPGMQIHQECRDGGCSRMRQNEVIPFPATNLEKPVSQEERRAEDQTPAKQERVPGVVLRPPESPPKKFPQSLGAVQTFFPHVEPEFIDKLRARCDRKVKQYTDTQLAQAINKAMKRTQTSEGLFLETVPGHLAVILSTRSDLTETQKRELKMARMILEGRQVDSSNPIEWTPDAVEQAREILRKYGGG